MAIEKTTQSVAMKILSNYGEQNGKIIKKSKSYNGVKTDATPEKIYNVYSLIKGVQEPVAESCMLVTTDLLTSNV